MIVIIIIFIIVVYLIHIIGKTTVSEPEKRLIDRPPQSAI